MTQPKDHAPAPDVPGEVIAEARLERAVFLAFRGHDDEPLRLGKVRVDAKRIFAGDTRVNGYSADVADVIDKLVRVRCLDYVPRGEWLALTDDGRNRLRSLGAGRPVT